MKNLELVGPELWRLIFKYIMILGKQKSFIKSYLWRQIVLVRLHKCQRGTTIFTITVYELVYIITTIHKILSAGNHKVQTSISLDRKERQTWDLDCSMQFRDLLPKVCSTGWPSLVIPYLLRNL